MSDVAVNPTLVMLAGLPGTGKSTLAAALTQNLRWLVLDKDLLNTVLLAAKLPQAQAGRLAYELVLTLARVLFVEQQQSLILDTAGRQPFILERARTIVRDAGGQLKVIRCVAPTTVRQARLRERTAGPSQWTQDETTLDQERIWYAHLPPETLVVHTDQPVENLVADILLFVQR